MHLGGCLLALLSLDLHRLVFALWLIYLVSLLFCWVRAGGVGEFACVVLAVVGGWLDQVGM